MSALLAANRYNLSLFDCTSFAIMRQSDMRRGFAYDLDFSELGSEVLSQLS
jgi:predicted nucleic acid-binding protein